MTTSYFCTWKQYCEASPQEQHRFWDAMIALWSENADNEIAVDSQFDRSEKLAAWLDEYTSIGDDAARIRHAGKMTTLRIVASKEHG